MLRHHMLCMERGVSVSECPCLQAIQGYVEWWGGGRRKEGLKGVCVGIGRSGEGGRCGERDRKWIDREREAVTFENGFQELTAFAR